MIFFLVLLLAFLLIEGAVTTIPFVLALFIAISVIKKDSMLFFVGLGSGIILDIFAMRMLGVTGLFFLCVICLVLLYERKFEITTVPFVFFATLICSALYLLVFRSSLIIPQALISAIAASLFFVLFRKTAGISSRHVS